jgi:hypothetical protein
MKQRDPTLPDFTQITYEISFDEQWQKFLALHPSIERRDALEHDLYFCGYVESIVDIEGSFYIEFLIPDGFGFPDLQGLMEESRQEVLDVFDSYIIED